MSKAAECLLELQKDDFRILQGIEVGMRTSEYVPVESIGELSKLKLDMIINRLNFLHAKELIVRWKGPFTGYQLTHHGFDVLAFRALSERDTIYAIGQPIGKGKESDVFLAYNQKKEVLVAKVHRVGRPSFQRSKKLRGYIGERGHINWLYKSRLSAEREFQGLEIAHKLKARVPIPLDHNRHVIILKYYDGIELANVMELKKPLKLFNGIISEIRKLGVEGGIIHADLSEFNVIITPKEDFLIIDFPQYESMDHINAFDLLHRDIFNICKYFKRKFNVLSDPSAIIEVILEDYKKMKNRKSK